MGIGWKVDILYNDLLFKCLMQLEIRFIFPFTHFVLSFNSSMLLVKIATPNTLFVLNKL